MEKMKFVDSSEVEQKRYVSDHFRFREEDGWYNEDELFSGKTIKDVIDALIAYENAEINAMGDCMTGFCQVQPRFEDFVKK